MNKEVAHLRTGPPLGQQRVGAPPIRDWPAPLSTNQRALARSRGGPADRGQERPFSSRRALTKSTGHWPIYKAWNILNYIPTTGALSAKNTIYSWFQAKAFPRAIGLFSCILESRIHCSSHTTSYQVKHLGVTSSKMSSQQAASLTGPSSSLSTQLLFSQIASPGVARTMYMFGEVVSLRRTSQISFQVNLSWHQHQYLTHGST